MGRHCITRTAALVATAAALSGCASGGDGAGGARGLDRLAGAHWLLIRVAKDRAGSVPVSAAPHTWLEITSRHEISDATVAALSRRTGTATGAR